MSPPISDTLHWRIGGPQGSGIDRSATLFARAVVSRGYFALSRREYHSNIMGRHSYTDVAVGVAAPLSVHQHPTMLVAFDAETLVRHLPAMADGSTVIYNPQSLDTPLDKLTYIEAPLRQTLDERYDNPQRVGDLLAAHRDLTAVALPYGELIDALAEEMGGDKRQAGRAINTLGVAVAAAVVGLPAELLQHQLEAVFPGKAAAIELNRAAIDCSYRWHASAELPESTRLSPPGADEPQPAVVLNGYEAAALGKLAAGLALQSYYPISPATDESSYLEAHARLQRLDGSGFEPEIVQVEDELAALGVAAGAALTGARSATATSGPGFSLMAETLGWCGMNEVPVVITLYQRGGPSTGMPTRTEQGDLLFAIRAGHGEFPRLVFASGDVEECFHDAMQAFDYAERYQLPVIHLLDKQLTASHDTLPPFAYHDLPIDRGERAQGESVRMRRFALDNGPLSPRPLLGEAGERYWSTGVEHSELGLVSEDPQTREAMMEKRAAKLTLILDELPEAEMIRRYGKPDAPLTLLSWGSNKGALLAVQRRLAAQGIETQVVMVRLLWPFPAAAIRKALEKSTTLVVIEGNQSGQLEQLLQQHLCRCADHLILKYSGRPITADALLPPLVQIAEGAAPARITLRNPYE